MTSTPNQLGKFITTHREARGLSQSQLAKEIGAPRSSVHYWESGKYDPEPHRLEALARALSVSYEDLYELLGYAIPNPAPAEYFRRRGYPREAVKEIERAVARVDRKYPTRRKRR
jgi:transcriptional regulator with XRE-family HTH domain